MTMRFRHACFFAILVTAAARAEAADWPRWLGPLGIGASPETGLITTWPSTGPKVLWESQGGDGYSSIAVAGGRAVTLVQADGQESVLALDAAKGTLLWKKEIAPAFKNMYGNGPRSTPTIEGDLIWVQSVSGPLVCLKATDGAVVWRKDLLKEFKTENITWGLSASPVTDDEHVYAMPGKGGGMVALKRATGELAWHTGTDNAAYATPVPVNLEGSKQVLFFNAAGLVALTADKGQELWRMPWVTEYECNICTPLLVGKDHLFVTSGEGVGCTMLKLKSAAAPSVVWESKGKKSVMINYWANSVVLDGHLYGLAGEFDKKIHFQCVDLKDGKLKWSHKDFGKGAITLADGHLFVTTKAGELVLIQPSPERYVEKARVKLLGDNRTVPTLANKRLYLRDKQKILCLDLGAGQ